MEFVKDYKCPKCKGKSSNPASIESQTLISKTKPIFTGQYANYEYEPGLTWIEVHECKPCKYLYCFSNGA